MSDSCDTLDCSLSGPLSLGILQARILEWVTISFPRGSSWPRDWTLISCIAVSLLFCRQILYQLSPEGSPILRQLRTIRVPYKLHNQMDSLICRFHGLILVLVEVLCIWNKERQCGRNIKCSDSRGKLLGFQTPVVSITISWILKNLLTSLCLGFLIFEIN